MLIVQLTLLRRVSVSSEETDFQQAKASEESRSMWWCWWCSSGLPGFPVLAFLVWNVFVAALVPEMAAGCSPEVTLVSVDWAASPRTGQRGGKVK